MKVNNRVQRTKTQKGRRSLEKKESQVVENPKKCFFVRGANTSETVRQCMTEMYLMKKVSSVRLQQKNKILPFEDAVPLERFSDKLDASLFTLVNHSKKRPDNLIIGRMFDHHLLDMVEFGIEDFKSMNTFSNSKISLGNKPCLVFGGPNYGLYGDNEVIRSLFLDFFKGEDATNIRLEGFEHVLSFHFEEDKIKFRSYKIILKKSGLRKPRVELEEIGPSFTMVPRRNKWASADLAKTALRKPKEQKSKKIKNITRDELGTKFGRVHMVKQDFKALRLRSQKALKRSYTEKNAEEEAAMLMAEKSLV